MTYCDVWEKLRTDQYTADYSDLPHLEKWPIDKIIDPDKSVNWNRQQVEDHNARRSQVMQERRQREAACHQQFSDDLHQYIADELEVPADGKVASLVYNKAWEDGHAAGYNEVLYHANDYIQLIRDTAAVIVEERAKRAAHE
ncbi:hypothetical protein [uncultured Duncaniella sp.]|uniref:hypothetical protein n=1 Tax=uncultured Duncaniella sp. TaxID=2768039 RepID=UPI00261E5228|nr:hypothetical protein [uncultured Duncaniella sp.]